MYANIKWWASSDYHNQCMIPSSHGRPLALTLAFVQKAGRFPPEGSFHHERYVERARAPRPGLRACAISYATQVRP